MVNVKEGWVEFCFYRPQAKQVSIAGEFNNWQTDELTMVRTDKGYWQAKMRLPAGEFRFRYCADGEWFTDYAAFGVQPTPYGLDSIVRVPNSPLRVVTADGQIAKLQATAAA